MGDNPYHQGDVPPRMGKLPPHPNAQQIVSAPAVALLVVAMVSLICFGLLVALNVFVLGSGLAAELPERSDGIGRETSMIIRMCSSIVLLLIHSVVAYGAYNMLNLQKRSLARTASIIAVIPCISPCYFLGIPFGIWALVTLGKPGISEAFKS